jgi:N-acyl-phosphatidylethanolamine-hydrolysing phospholipase D
VALLDSVAASGAKNTCLIWRNARKAIKLIRLAGLPRTGFISAGDFRLQVSVSTRYRLFYGITFGLILFGISTCSYDNGVDFNPSKTHHGDGRFISDKEGSLFSWLSMRWNEDSPPEIDQTQLPSIIGQVDRKLIDSPALIPRATWIGHATVLLQYRDINFLTDPHLTQRPFGLDFLVSERYTQPALSFKEMPKIDFIVISHNHYDHLDHRTVDMFANSVTWFVPLGLKPWFLERGIESDRVIELDWWESHQFSPEVVVTFTPTVHWSKRTPWDTNKTLWGGWAVDIAGFKSWHAGDTGFSETLFREIGERLGPLRLAMIPIGAYAPRYFMSSSHIDPQQAVKVHLDVRAQQSMPIHWGAFQLTHEPILEPPQQLREELERLSIPLSDFEPLKIGDTKILK